MIDNVHKNSLLKEIRREYQYVFFTLSLILFNLMCKPNALNYIVIGFLFTFVVSGMKSIYWNKKCLRSLENEHYIK